MDHNIYVDISGWIGVAAFLIAYVFVSTGRVEGNSITFQLLNLMGGVLLIINSFYYGAYPSVGVNIAWIGVAIYVLARRKLKSRS